MIARVISSSIVGIDAEEVQVEVDVTGGVPAFKVVGLPDAAVRESIDRVKAAIKNCGFIFPSEKITVNLAPADVKKEGPCFDLPIALGILAASGQLGQKSLNGNVVCGELALDGNVRPINGCLSRAIASSNSQYCRLLVPAENAAEAALVKGIEVYALSNLMEAVLFIRGELELEAFKGNGNKVWQKSESNEIDFSDIRGQQFVKRGLEVAAAGGHNILMIGPPGSGKTILARALSGILPPMSIRERLEVTKIHSAAGLIDNKGGIILNRPFRALHNTASEVAIVGGGKNLRPGEITLAHNGVLFLDEFCEFRRDVLEGLRQPLEDGKITISRAAGSITYPAKFMLIAAANPCPCGFFLDNTKQCHCAPQQIQKYLSKMSGPLLDRIDIHLEVPRLKYEQMMSRRKGEPSKVIRQRINRAWSVQGKRLRNLRVRCNARLSSRQIEELCVLSGDAKELIKAAILELGLSARAYHKILKISRTIADLSESGEILPEHVSEAVSYRCLDRNLWSI